MRCLIFTLCAYLAIAFQPAPPIPTQAASVVAATRFLKSTGSKAVPIGKRKRRRIKRVIHRKPVTVYVSPDVVQVITWAEYWRGMEAARAAAWVRWF